jgi:hypothetical protein
VKKSLSKYISTMLEKDPRWVLVFLGSTVVFILSLFFCLAFPPDLKMWWVFCLVLLPLAMPLGFYFGKVNRSIILKKQKNKDPDPEPKQIEKQKKKKEGGTLSQFEVSKKLSKWAKKSELEKSQQAHQLSKKPLWTYVPSEDVEEDEEDEDDY